VRARAVLLLHLTDQSRPSSIAPACGARSHSCTSPDVADPPQPGASAPAKRRLFEGDSRRAPRTGRLTLTREGRRLRPGPGRFDVWLRPRLRPRHVGQCPSQTVGDQEGDASLFGDGWMKRRSLLTPQYLLATGLPRRSCARGERGDSQGLCVFRIPTTSAFHVCLPPPAQDLQSLRRRR